MSRLPEQRWVTCGVRVVEISCDNLVVSVVQWILECIHVLLM